MNALTSPTQIANLALSHIGIAPIADIENPTTKEENVAARFFDLGRQHTLRVGGFGFATKREQIARVTSPSLAFGSEAIYQKPSDYLNLLSFHGPQGWSDVSMKRGYKVEGPYLVLTDLRIGHDDHLNIRYTCDFKEVAGMDSTYITALSYFLAARFCYPFKRSTTEVQSLDEQYEKFMAEAMAVDGRENPVTVIRRNTLALNNQGWERDPRFYKR